MEGSWWRDQSDLDEEQLKFIDAPMDGRYLLMGPPGSGKTNLLLLRAKYFYGSGLKNILFLTYTNELASFIKTGIGSKGYLPPDCIMTYHSWAGKHVRDHLGPSLMGSSEKFDEESRGRLIDLVGKATKKSVTKKMYEMILIDEAQDLSKDEIALLLQLSDRVAMAGDIRQGIYDQDGLKNLTKFNLEPVALKFHYRIGPEICKIADKIITPNDPSDRLENYCNYKDTNYGSSALMEAYATEDTAFTALLSNLENQLKAYPDQAIGILVAKNETIDWLAQKFRENPIEADIAYHNIKDSENSFSSGKLIHVMTAHSSKGAEFRAVHIFAAEKFKFPLQKRELLYTAVTRAKTSVTAYRTNKVLGYLDAAFAKPTLANIADLF